MNHFAPHPGSQFEGYYSKFDFPSGAHLALVVCTVPNAKEKPYMVAFTYVPADGKNIFQREVWVSELEMVKTSADHAFEHRFPELGSVVHEADSTTTYSLKHDDFTFSAKTTSRTPWSAGTDTPESLLVHLPLPLHWHVHSLASACDFTLSIPSYDLPEKDQSGTAVVHQEKNWADSFPSAHMWIQARNPTTKSGICIAGGQILGLEAYLLGYRCKETKYSLDFRPPLAIKMAGLSPTMSVSCDWETRTFDLSVQSWVQKIVVKASAPKGTFFPLSAPFAEGFRANFLGESFKADIKVQVYEAGWFGPWVLKHEEDFKEGSLEFGGGYYPPAGSEQKWN